MSGNGTFLRIAGICLLLAAAALTTFNLWEDRQASLRNQEALTQIRQIRSETVRQESYQLPRTEEHQLPFFEEFPEVEMPVIMAGGVRYIGTLEIPSRGLVLSVTEDWDYEKLRTAPCRYTGSVYTRDMVICAHNYTTHFACLAALEPGTEVRFTDCDGNVFLYEVIAMEILQPEQTRTMVEGSWDLTLFTCTLGGDSRITIRCGLVDSIPV